MNLLDMPTDSILRVHLLHKHKKITNRSIVAICQEFTGLFYIMSPFLVIWFEL